MMTLRETILTGGIKALEDDIRAELKNPSDGIEKLLQAYLRSIERTTSRADEIKDGPNKEEKRWLLSVEQDWPELKKTFLEPERFEPASRNYTRLIYELKQAWGLDK